MRELILRNPLAVLAVAALLTAGAGWTATWIEPEVDFVDTVPDHPGLAPYRALIDELDGIRFIAIYQAHDTAFGPHLRTDEGFAALVAEQGEFAAALRAAFPADTFSHQLSAHEGMKAGNYMLEKIATSGNPRAEAYAVPEDQVRYDLVRDQILADGSIDDVLAMDGSSALMLFFFATSDSIEARHLTGDVAEFIADWRADNRIHPATRDHQPSGLLWASQATDEINQSEMARLAPWAAVGVALALLWVVRRPSNVLIASIGMAVALTWTYGLMGLSGIKVSFLTLFLAPIVVGVGIDYAVHMLHRYEEERDRGSNQQRALSAAGVEAGRAIGLAALTTVAGLAVLLFVPNPLFAEIGGVSALGIALAFVAAVTVVPALRAILPDMRSGSRRDRAGPVLARWAARAQKNRWASVGVAVLVTGGAMWIASGTTIESGSAENEFPQDDPIIMLQHRIEAEYGAFQRAYIVFQGDLTQPATLQAMHQTVVQAGNLSLFREASAVTSILLADEATDDGAVDILSGMIAGPTGQSETDGQRLPQTQAEAKAALDALYADPLWQTIAPFTITRDYQLGIVAITIEPWADQVQLREFVADLQALADTAQQLAGDDAVATAAGSPVNRAELLKQTPKNVAIATLGATGAVLLVLAVAWRKRGVAGLKVAAVGGAIVGAAALWLLAAITILDKFYDITGSANNAVLSDMFLLAFAVTVAVGVDDLVHVVHRYWLERDNGVSPKDAVEMSFRTAGRAVTGTTITTFVAFAILADAYFLQSKNLAILTALGILFAYAMTMLVVPAVLAPGKAKAVYR